MGRRFPHVITKIARYEVRRETVAQAVDAVKAFVDEVKRKEGGTARYEVFQGAGEPTRFTHVMVFRTPSAEDYHQKTAWCKRFVATLDPLCVEKPVFETVNAL